MDEINQPEMITLDPTSMEVTKEEYLELIVSPKKCMALGIDNTYERRVYTERRQWQDWPPLPPIDPNEEIDEHRDYLI
jgi:hypothetical protein